MAGNVRVVLKSVFDDKGIKAAQSEFAKVGKTVGVAFAAVGATLAVAGAAAVRFGSDAIKAAESVQQANNRLAQVNESMGLFGGQTEAVTKRLIEFAEANELSTATDAEVIKATQAKLLTFKNLAKTADQVGGAMDRATMAALDLAAAGFGSAETNAVQLGKALQDPIKGITALARAGVTFTAQEKEKIKALVESGRVLDAQNLILEAIETQVGGTAQATAKASDKMTLAFDNIKEEVGAALLPAFEEFTQVIIDLTPEISKALTPVAEEFADVIRRDVTPAIKEFTEWLASPEGTKAVKDLTTAIGQGIRDFFDFAKELMKNWDSIVKYTTAVAAATVVIRGITTAVTAAKGIQLLWNGAIAANPIGALVVVLGLAIAAVITFSKELTEEERAVRKTTNEVVKLEQQQIQLTEKIKQGGIEVNAYKKQLQDVNSKLVLAKSGMSESAGEANRFTTALKNAKTAADAMNNASLKKYRGQLGDTRVDAERLVEAQRELAYYMAGGKPGTYKPRNTTTGGGGGGGGNKGMTPAEQKKEFDKIAKDTQAALRKARATYNAAVSTARKEYTEAVVKAESEFSEAITRAGITRDSNLKKAAEDNTKRVAEIQRSFSNQLASIIQQSQDRLRDVYRTAVTTNIADLFGSESVGKSVDKLVGSLREKLLASRQLLDNASKLAAAGFSQTFIEQVIAAGTTSGNELAKSILEATPETQTELKSLYGALETQSETGMDDLARTIYEGAGLATSELRKLYDQTVVDQTNALTEQAALYAEAQAQILTEFDNAITEANAKRNEALSAAKKALQDALVAATKEYRDSLDQIQKDFEDRIDALGKLQEGLLKRQAIVSAQIGGAQANIPSVASQIDAVQKATVVTIPPTSAITGGNTVNVNVKVDPGVSAAQAGKKIANVVQKYTTAGGGGSAMPWLVE